MIRVLVLAVSLILPLAAGAEIAPRFKPLFNLIGLSETVTIMRDEGLDYGASLRDEMFPGRAEAQWTRDVERIYTRQDMLDEVEDGMVSALQADDIEPIVAFFRSDLGRRIVELEVSARRAIFDADVEEMAKARFDDLVGELDPRVDMLMEFVEVNDLVEANVTGALNSNLAFYRGLKSGGAEGYDLSEAEMLSEVWSQEADIRVDTEEWIYSYLSLAYAPLKDAEFQAYIDFSRTDAGRDINRALFEAFDAMFTRISTDLGRRASLYMAGQDI